jgi:hypothetical protein
MRVRLPQIRDAVIAMLEDWVGEGGRVPPEKLATAVFETLSGPKMSPEVRTDWPAIFANDVASAPQAHPMPSLAVAFQLSKQHAQRHTVKHR